MTAREEYVRKMHSKLDQMNNEIDKLVASKDKIAESGRIEFDKQMDELRRRRDDALAKLDQLQGASENAWEDIKAGTELAWEAITQSIESARTRFKS